MCETLECPTGYELTANAPLVACACSTCVPDIDRDTCCQEIQCPALTTPISGTTAGANGCLGGSVLTSPTCSFICGTGYSI